MRKTAAGFSLIEVLVSLVILSVGLLSLAKFQTNIMRSNIQAKERTDATLLAQEVIDIYRSETIGQISVPEFVDDYQTTSFTVTQRVRVLSMDEKEIKVTVTWPDMAHADAEVTDETTVSLMSVVSEQKINSLASRSVLYPSVGFTCFSGGVVNVGEDC